MSDVASFLPYLSAALGLFLTIFALFALPRIAARQLSDIQTKVIEAQKSQLDTMEERVAQLEKEDERNKRVLATIRYALKQRGLFIRVNGDYITLVDRGKERIVQLRADVEQVGNSENDNEEDDDTAKHQITSPKK